MPLDAAKSRLVEEHLLFARKIAKNHAKQHWRHYDDILQESRLGLVEAAESFVPGRGCEFTTWAYFRCRGRILDWLRSQNLKGYRGASRREGKPWVSSLTDDETARDSFVHHDPFDYVDSFDEFASFLTSLPETDAACVRLVYVEGLNNREAGERLGINPKAVSQLVQRSAATLAVLLETKRDGTSTEA